MKSCQKVYFPPVGCHIINVLLSLHHTLLLCEVISLRLASNDDKVSAWRTQRTWEKSRKCKELSLQSLLKTLFLHYPNVIEMFTSPKQNFYYHFPVQNMNSTREQVWSQILPLYSVLFLCVFSFHFLSTNVQWNLFWDKILIFISLTFHWYMVPYHEFNSMIKKRQYQMNSKW